MSEQNCKAVKAIVWHAPSLKAVEDVISGRVVMAKPEDKVAELKAFIRSLKCDDIPNCRCEQCLSIDAMLSK